MHPPRSLIPANESQRLQALAPYVALSPAPDAVLDDLVRLTAKLFNVPIALVSLVEEDSVWFKATVGLPGVERVGRAQSMCSVAILQGETTLYDDLQKQPCHLTDPAVAEALQLRFYAGHPLLTPAGYAIGVLCVLDREPRTLDLSELRCLQALASLVMQLLELRRLLQHQPAQAGAVWTLLYGQLDEMLTRIGTLTELAQWEEAPDTPARQAYQRSIAEETDQIIGLLEQHTTDAIAALQATSR
jgi:GAF domain-containing protein